MYRFENKITVVDGYEQRVVADSSVVVDETVEDWLLSNGSLKTLALLWPTVDECGRLCRLVLTAGTTRAIRLIASQSPLSGSRSAVPLSLAL